MSSNYNHKVLHTESNFDKENAFISSNISNEKRYSGVRQYRKHNDLVLKPSFVQCGQDSLGLQTANVPSNLPHIPNKIYKETDVIRKLNASKVKKSLAFERSSLNGRPGDLLNAQKERPFYAEKENKTYVLDRSDRYTFGEATKANLADNKRSSFIEPARRSYGERDQIKLNPVFEPAPKNDRQEVHVLPENNTSNFVEHEERKPTPPPVVDHKEQCNKTIADYAPEIMEALKMKDKESTPVYPLENHKIPVNLRAKMIDWMVEVLSSYKCSDQTFFLAVSLMDLFFQKTTVVHEVSDLHLVGVTCMFMASKYEEIYPLRLNVVHDKIAHRKLSHDQLKRKEMEIFATLGYKMTNVTPFEFIMNALFQLNLKETMSPKLYEYLQKVCVYLAKANMHDYELVSQQDYSELAASTLFVAFKIIEQLDKSFPLNQMLRKLREILDVEEDIVYDCATRILSVAKNFDKLYPNLENLKKFHSFNFDSVITSHSSAKGRAGTNV